MKIYYFVSGIHFYLTGMQKCILSMKWFTKGEIFTSCFNFDLNRSASKKKMCSEVSIFKPCQNTFPPCKSDNEYSMGIVSRSSQSIKIDSNQLILSNDNGNRCKSINWIAVSNRYYRFFMILPIYNAKSDIVVFGHKLNSTAEKTHPRVTTDQQT